MTKFLTEAQLQAAEETQKSTDFAMEHDGVKLETKTVTTEGTNPYTDDYYKAKLDGLAFTGDEVVNDNVKPGKGQLQLTSMKLLEQVARRHGFTLIRSRNKRKNHIFFQIGLVKVAPDGTWEPVEIAEHKTLAAAALTLIATLNDKGF